MVQGNPGEKNILHRKNIYIYRSWHIMLKKNLTPLYVGEKNRAPEVWEKPSYPN